MTQQSTAHPPAEQLAAFGLGRLEPALTEQIAAHLEACAACRAAVERQPDDALAALVRSAARTVGGGGDTRCDDVAAALADHPRYAVERLLGCGGMGAVYKARHRLMERVVALKVIQPHFLAKPSAAERFRREVKAAAALNHPNIVAAYDADHGGGLTFLVME